MCVEIGVDIESVYLELREWLKSPFFERKNSSVVVALRAYYPDARGKRMAMTRRAIFPQLEPLPAACAMKSISWVDFITQKLIMGLVIPQDSRRMVKTRYQGI